MIKEKLLNDLKEAMKDKNLIRKNTIQMVRAAVLQVEKDKQIELTDEQVIEIIAKESKKRNFLKPLQEHCPAYGSSDDIFRSDERFPLPADRR